MDNPIFPLSDDEGYIKYRCIFTPAPAPDATFLSNINLLRTQLHRLNLIGAYPNGIGFGNISVRVAQSNQFIISGTQTGHLPNLLPEHYALVYEYNMSENTVYCSGKTKASSEALTHAAVYEADATCRVVIHVHHARMWQKWLHILPTTEANISYGTPQMANEIKRLYAQTDLPTVKIMLMAGHTDGLIVFGASGTDALNTLMQYYRF